MLKFPTVSKLHNRAVSQLKLEAYHESVYLGALKFYDTVS